MSLFICVACGTQYPEANEPPPTCKICADQRQFVPPSGQQWTTLEKLRALHRNSFHQCEPGLISIGTVPEFAIGERAFLLRTPHGNFLWDCISLIDDATVEIVRGLGGLRGIAISHPHYYTTMLEWSRAFGDVPIHLHADDREWVVREGDAIDFWQGERRELAPGVTLIRCGGHFPGATVLHWAAGADGRGILLSGDVLQVVADGSVSFMFSYPNMIPLPARTVRAVADAVRPFAFDRIYGAFWNRVVQWDAHAIVERSAERYVRALESD
jgi:glyoxylase-like metal-dependent hydrolase (beta-lactamase superfamily II)